ncbi:MAG: transglutaminase-like domain-containing protein, partial [Chthoniobacterales bacterium]
KNPLVTPTLEQIVVSANAQVNSISEASGITLEKFENQHIVRSSLPYSYQRPSEKLTELRNRYKLDEVIAPGKTEWEQLVLLRNWVRRQWPQNENGAYERDWNALEILGAPDGHHGMCVHYGIAFTQCAAALGFNARPLILQNHFIADAWSNDNEKWVAMDVEAAVKPTHDTAHYIDTTTKKPLSILEVHKAFHHALQDGKSQIDTVTQVYYADANGKSQEMELRSFPMTYLVPKRFLYPPRNDYLDHPEPSEEAHGCDNYHSSAYYWWRSEFPAGEEPEYPFKTNREGDLFWTLNQAQLTLTASDKKDVLNVTAETFTPNVKDFEYKTDRGDWKPLAGKGNDPDNRVTTLEWSLHPGKNQLWVRPVNVFDRKGITSYVEVKKS